MIHHHTCFPHLYTPPSRAAINLYSPLMDDFNRLIPIAVVMPVAAVEQSSLSVLGVTCVFQGQWISTCPEHQGPHPSGPWGRPPRRWRRDDVSWPYTDLPRGGGTQAAYWGALAPRASASEGVRQLEAGCWGQHSLWEEVVCASCQVGAWCGPDDQVGEGWSWEGDWERSAKEGPGRGRAQGGISRRRGFFCIKGRRRQRLRCLRPWRTPWSWLLRASTWPSDRLGCCTVGFNLLVNSTKRWRSLTTDWSPWARSRICRALSSLPRARMLKIKA